MKKDSLFAKIRDIGRFCTKVCQVFHGKTETKTSLSL